MADVMPDVRPAGRRLEGRVIVVTGAAGGIDTVDGGSTA